MNVNYESDLTDEEDGNDKQLNAPKNDNSPAKKAGSALKLKNQQSYSLFNESNRKSGGYNLP